MLKRQKTGRVAQKWKHWCGAALLLAGCLIFFSPNLHQQYQDKRIQKEIAEFHMQSEPEEKSDLFGKIQRYNQELFESGQNCLYEPAYVEKAPEIDGIVSDKMFGYVEIPSIDCTLPLYLGASEEKLNQGAAVLGGTSVPIGGNNTNCVIAAHRGWKQQVYFKYIDALKHGDCIIVTNPWERLEYVVSDIQVIEPDEIERIKIQSGTDQVTLITCHPYRSSGKYRYVVSAKRKETGTVGVSEAGKKDFVAINIEKDMMNAEIGFGRKVLEAFEKYGISFEHMPSGVDTMTVIVHQSEFEEKEQKVLTEIKHLVHPDVLDLEPDIALIAIVGRGMREARGTAGRIFSALAHAKVNVKMIDQGSSEINIIVGVKNSEFETAIKAIYDIFVVSQL